MTETESPIGVDIFKSLLLKGILMIILGVIMMIFTFGSILAIDYLFGIVLIILGIQLLTSGSTFLGEYKRTWWVILLGILAIIFGIVAFVFPTMMTLYIVFMIAITSLISGFTDLALAISDKCGVANRALVAISGVLGIILGILFIISPLVGAYVIVQVTGIFLLAFGILAIAEGFMVKKAVQTA
ncbi:HdeD family acid-resistance protein [Methanocorpusculum vombati]|uniref:DUF308 domain-containing protein n=1 Tax=Methanocorpusculum vombati TaxID=3002864 RepID=A0ABT4INM0_9EURY|nr:DUF308 domain-containing protein [Methanocorpusculum vombati]MCZ9320306.1 DUF308 domain-containing protein [Methanocorpusculum sp.]MCZ0862683.1 DUF308 domain-containing protein [Methanocorpusculum vombati]MDE2520035.1 DUF308 domain-containing protein [Methanocorpusculum sp.]MDE2535174.1 DUF308 domain-containing protein [Methanocorpusculum sp.]MDE2545351.1 DUF308 domain-containing protein [Methanocorpusculum sp.]